MAVVYRNAGILTVDVVYENTYRGHQDITKYKGLFLAKLKRILI